MNLIDKINRLHRMLKWILSNRQDSRKLLIIDYFYVIKLNQFTWFLEHLQTFLNCQCQRRADIPFNSSTFREYSRNRISGLQYLFTTAKNPKKCYSSYKIKQAKYSRNCFFSCWRILFRWTKYCLARPIILRWVSSEGILLCLKCSDNNIV